MAPKGARVRGFGPDKGQGSTIWTRKGLGFEDFVPKSCQKLFQEACLELSGLILFWPGLGKAPGSYFRCWALGPFAARSAVRCRREAPTVSGSARASSCYTTGPPRTIRLKIGADRVRWCVSTSALAQFGPQFGGPKTSKIRSKML